MSESEWEKKRGRWRCGLRPLSKRASSERSDHVSVNIAIGMRMENGTFFWNFFRPQKRQKYCLWDYKKEYDKWDNKAK